MAAPSAAEARAALRHLLRAVDRHLTAVAGNQQWRAQVLASFREAPSVDAGVAREGLQLARDYADLINGVAHHRDLLNTYNLGIDADERNRRMVEATARRVGFALPYEEAPPRRQRGSKGAGDGVGQAAQQQQQQQQQQAAEGGGNSSGGHSGSSGERSAS